MGELNENMRQHGDNYFLVPNIFDEKKKQKYKIKTIFKKLFKDKVLLECFSLELKHYKK